MHSSLLALAALSIAATSVPASSAAGDSVIAQPAGPLTPGAWGLGFQIVPDRSSGTIAVRRAVTPTMDVGVEASLSGNYTEEQIQSQNFEGVLHRDGQKSNSSFSLVAPVGFLSSSREGLAFAWQIGPMVTYSASEDNSQETVGYQDQGSGDWNLSFGAQGKAGLRWFFHSNLALTADYEAGISYRRSTRSYHQTDSSQTYGQRTTDWSVNAFSGFYGVGLEGWF